MSIIAEWSVKDGDSLRWKECKDISCMTYDCVSFNGSETIRGPRVSWVLESGVELIQYADGDVSCIYTRVEGM